MTGSCARSRARARVHGVTLVVVGMVIGGCTVGVAMSGGPDDAPEASAPASVESEDATPTRPTPATTLTEQAAPTAADPSTVVPTPSPPPSIPVAPAPIPPPAPPPAPQPDVWVVVDVIDGDTVDARRDGVLERVRVVGLDTPEQGQCGFEEAARALTFLALDRQVLLTPGARDARDRYDRLLAYVDVVEDAASGATLDAGLSLITDGYGIARYDSRDGYGAHAREAEYVAADAASPPRIDCGAAPAPLVVPAPPGPVAAGCDAAYPGVCIPPAPPDLDCGDVPHRSFAVLAPDPHRFDADGDGRGCTSG